MNKMELKKSLKNPTEKRHTRVSIIWKMQHKWSHTEYEDETHLV